MTAIFTNAEGRLRAGWRVLLYGLLLLVMQVALSIAVNIFAFAVQLPIPLIPDDIGQAMVIGQVVAVATVSLSTYAARRWLDRRSLASLGLAVGPGWSVDLIAGLLLGGLLQALIFAVEAAAGWIAIDGPMWPTPAEAAPSLLFWALAFLCVGWNEELVTRGYLLQNIRDGLGTPWAVALTSLGFGALHVANPGASAVAVAGVALAGLLFAVAYLVTRSLWMPIGLHAGWNFAEGPLFGFPVSGIDAGGLFIQRPVGPELITGGAFGPEAGLISLFADACGIGLVWWYGRRRVSLLG